MGILQWLGFKSGFPISFVCFIHFTSLCSKKGWSFILKNDECLYVPKYTIKHFDSPKTDFVLHLYLSWAFSSYLIPSITWTNWRFSSDVIFVITSSCWSLWTLWIYGSQASFKLIILFLAVESKWSVLQKKLANASNISLYINCIIMSPNSFWKAS
jgi:hypothetical protein